MTENNIDIVKKNTEEANNNLKININIILPDKLKDKENLAKMRPQTTKIQLLKEEKVLQVPNDNAIKQKSLNNSKNQIYLTASRDNVESVNPAVSNTNKNQDKSFNVTIDSMNKKTDSPVKDIKEDLNNDSDSLKNDKNPENVELRRQSLRVGGQINFSNQKKRIKLNGRMSTVVKKNRDKKRIQTVGPAY